MNVSGKRHFSYQHQKMNFWEIMWCLKFPKRVAICIIRKVSVNYRFLSLILECLNSWIFLHLLYNRMQQLKEQCERKLRIWKLFSHFHSLNKYSFNPHFMARIIVKERVGTFCCSLKDSDGNFNTLNLGPLSKVLLKS